jgi:putative methylase
MVIHMKKKQLEMLLQQTPAFPKPQPALEQYQTPATIASDILFFSYQNHDILQKNVVDLGCGTGIFSFGAAVLGAKSVLGIDIDQESIILAKEFAHIHKLNITFLTQDISLSDFSADTVIMNPPFGAQKNNIHADQLFLRKAIKHASVIYSIHLTKTISHLEKFIEHIGGKIDDVFEVPFPLKAQFDFHKKLIETVPVSCLRIIHSSAEG